MSDTPSFVEQQRLHAETERMREEAASDRKAAAEDRRAAEYERGQAAHALKTAQATEAGYSAREKWLKENKEDELRQLAADADAKLKAAEELMARYDKDRHAAMLKLTAPDQRGEAA